jgi:hypothetical protein
VSDTEHVVLDNKTSDDTLIESSHLDDPKFKLGLWYAQQRQSALGLESAEVLQEERFLTELGDAYLGGAWIALEHSEWDGSPETEDTCYFTVQEKDEDYYTVFDLRNDTQALLLKNSLRNPQFDLIA